MMNVGIFGRSNLLSGIHEIYTVTVYGKCQYKYKKESSDNIFLEGTYFA